MKISNIKLLESLRLFGDWWVDELRQLLPSFVERWISGNPARVVLLVSVKQVELYLYTAGQKIVLGRFASAVGLDRDVKKLSMIVAERVPKDTVVEVVLSGQQVLTREVFLPSATERTLADVIRFEMDRLTPFNADEVGYAWCMLGQIPEREKLKVELQVVRRDYLSELVFQATLLGLAVDGVYAKQQVSQGEKDDRKNLLPEDLRPERAPLWGSRNKILLGVLLLALSLVVIFPVYWQMEKIEGLETEIAAVSSEAKAASKKQQLLLARLEGQEALINKKNQHPAKLEIIRELTALLPDNTSVSKLVIDDETVSLQGESLKSSDLIETLEQTQMFKNVEFVSPVTRNPSSGMERYQLRLQLAETLASAEVVP